MIRDLNARRSVEARMKLRCANAPIAAATWLGAMWEEGDLDGCAVWKRILRAVRALQGMAPRPHEGFADRTYSLSPRSGIRFPGQGRWKPASGGNC